MALTPDEVPRVAQQILVMRRQEQHRLQRISKYMRGKHDSVYVPQGARTEYKWLLRRSVVNYLPLVVSTVSQQLHVDGYRPALPGSEPAPSGSGGEVAGGVAAAGVIGIAKENAPAWDIFVANRLMSKQHGLHRSVMKYGVAYMVVLPGEPQPVMRPVSPRRLTALYQDDVDDEWPVYAVEERIQSTARGQYRIVRLYDEQSLYILTGSVNSADLHFPEQGDPVIPIGTAAVQEHGLGVCPVVRFLHEIDLDGEMDVSGEAEPLIPLQDQINTTTFNILMAQQYAAFRQRWVTGMVPDDEEGRAKEPFRSGVDRLWVAEDADTKFGEFSQTSLKDYLDGREKSIQHMATISQVPPYHLLGTMINLSAEALAASRDALDRKCEELQGVLSEPWKQSFQLASLAVGDKTGWDDQDSSVTWRDTSARAFAATVDALGKLAQMLGVPATELWHKIPGVSAQEVEQWRAAATSGDALEQLNRLIEAQMTHGIVTPDEPQPGSPAMPFQGPARQRERGI